MTSRPWYSEIRTCSAPVRGSSAKCVLTFGHDGSHSTVAFTCDSCGKRVRGRPHREGPEGLGFCFLCCQTKPTEAYDGL